MNRMFIYYILCSGSFLWTFKCSETQPGLLLDQIEASLREGLEIYLETGRRTAQLNDTIKELQLPNLFRSEENKAFSQAACIVCHAGVGVIIAARRIGFTKEVLMNFLEKLCVWFNIESETVCHGVITINADSIVYIIDHRKTLTSVRVCSILLQMYDCVDPGRKDWVLNIPESNRTHLKSKPSKPEKFKIIHISDIHYDPEYEIGSRGGCKEPLCCQKSSQPSNDQDAAGYWGDYRNCDMPWHTITDSLNHIATRHVWKKDADFVYFTGDVINHKVWDTKITENMKAMTMVFRQLNQTFGSTPVYPILGNHEPHPVNLFSSDNVNEPHLTTQWVFDLVAKEWKMWLLPETYDTLLKGGYYTTLIKKGLRLIGLNSNVCYTFNWWLLYDDFDPYGQLRWLIRTLLQAEENDEFVHILSHIPNGANTCLENWSREYAKIINRFSHIISAQFNGHTHNDRTLIFFNQSDPSHAINVAFDGGSLTTYSNLNPNYKVFEVADVTGEVLDYESWTFNLTQANLNHERSPDWYKLYSFKETYGVESLSPKHILQLTERIAKIPKLSQLYFRNKIREADPELLKGCDKDCEINNLCEMVTFKAGDMVHCEILRDIYNSARPRNLT